MRLINLTLFAALLLITQVTHAQFYEVPSNTSKDLKCIDFPSNLVGYIGGADSIFLKTIDGGLTWTEVNYSGITFPGEPVFNKLQFLTDDLGYTSVGDFQGIYKTVDGGSTWTAVPLEGSQCYTYSFFFRAEDTGVIGGTGCFLGEQIQIVTPTGNSLATVNDPGLGPQSAMVQDIDFYGSSFGMAASRGGRVLRTIDGGLNWDTIATGLGNTEIKAIEIIDDTTVQLSLGVPHGGAHGMRSIDGGLTWSTDGATFGTPMLNDLHDSGDGVLWSGGTSEWDPVKRGAMMERDSAGWWWMEWTVRDTIHGISSYNDSIIWGVGDSGLIVVNEDFGVLNIKLPEIQPLEFYPNPVSDLINFSIPDHLVSELNAIQVRDINGKLIDQFSALTKSYNPTNWPAGIYFIELLSDGAVLRSKLVKN